MLIEVITLGQEKLGINPELVETCEPYDNGKGIRVYMSSGKVHYIDMTYEQFMEVCGGNTSEYENK